MEEDKNSEQNLDKSNEKLHISDVIQQSEQFFCCVVENGQPKCKEQCQFCKDWVDDAEEQKNCV